MQNDKQEINDIAPSSIRHMIGQKGVIDQVTVALLRVRRGQRPWVGDRRHLSHRLARRRGLGEVRTVMLLVGAQLLLNGLGVWLLLAVPVPGTVTWSLSAAGFLLFGAAMLAVRDPKLLTDSRP